jgi:hypothetical protein
VIDPGSGCSWTATPWSLVGCDREREYGFRFGKMGDGLQREHGSMEHEREREREREHRHSDADSRGWG